MEHNRQTFSIFTPIYAESCIQCILEIYGKNIENELLFSKKIMLKQDVATHQKTSS